MRLRISDAALVPELMEFLQTRLDAAVDRVSDDEVEVSLLGSYAVEAMRMELYLRIRAWEAGRRSRGASVALVNLIDQG